MLFDLTQEYDPEVGRFINADGILGANNDMLSYNLFAYCGNNPVNRIDPNGEGAEFLQNLSQQLAQYGPIGMIFSVGVLTIYGILIIPWDKVGSGISNAWNNAVNVWNTVAVGVKDLAQSFAIDYAKVDSKSKAKENTTDITRTFPKGKIVQYWGAQRIKSNVVIGRPLEYTQAIVRLMSAQDVMCINQKAAFGLAKLFRNYVGPEKHGNGTEEYYYHYHMNRNSHIHIWFMGDVYF